MSDNLWGGQYVFSFAGEWDQVHSLIRWECEGLGNNIVCQKPIIKASLNITKNKKEEIS